jgi:hypothetical protein
VEIAGIHELWAETLGGPRVCIAVLDGPADLSHACFARAKISRLDPLIACSPPSFTRPASRHGTHVASVIFGSHQGPVKGIAPLCRGLILPVFAERADGSLAPCSQFDLARAITQAVHHGAQIVNISGGERSPSGAAHPVLARAVADCLDNGALLIAAAGNEGCDCLYVPGALPSVIAVGAMSSEGAPLQFSNWGELYRKQGILAPGEDILGAVPGGGAVTQTGTSYAAAIVAGIAALLWSLARRYGVEPDAKSVRKAILDSAVGCAHNDALDCRRLLAGRLNIPGAATLVTRGGNKMIEQIEGQEETCSMDAGVRSAACGPPPATPVSDAPAPAAGVRPAGAERGCHCGCGGGAAQMVFALGQLGFDYGTEARRDSIRQHMSGTADPHDANQLLAYLERNPSDAASIIWTLSLDATPIYAIEPHGAFASDTYKLLRQFLREQLGEAVERVSIPGHVSGSARLFNGQVVPVIHPEPRGLFNWTTAALVEAVAGKPLPADAKQTAKEAYNKNRQSVENFLRRIYDELRNLGATPQERALNYSATNALLVENVFRDAIKEQMDLDTIAVERSPICRPESDCWDVKLTFFDPEKIFQRGRKMYRFAVDVSDVVPVMVGPVRSWFVR